MTSTKPHILGIPGSLRQATYSRAVLRGLQEIARELGTETKIPVYGRLLLLRSGEVAPATLHHPARDNQTDGWGHVGPRSRGVLALPRPRRVACRVECPLLSYGGYGESHPSESGQMLPIRGGPSGFPRPAGRPVGARFIAHSEVLTATSTIQVLFSERGSLPESGGGL